MVSEKITCIFVYIDKTKKIFKLKLFNFEVYWD